MTTKIKAVIFDQGGVLTPGGEKGANERAALHVMRLGPATDVSEITKLLEDLKRGKKDNETFLAAVNRRYPEAPEPLTDKMWDIVYAAMRPDQTAHRFAERCRRAGLRVGLLSNINPVVASRLRRDKSYEGFNPLILSCEVGCAKPDKKIYQKVEAALPGIKPSEILLLDDQDKCVLGARARGWQALKVISSKQMIREASELLGLS